MLFVLTGDVQTGKTRWLTSLVEMLEREGVRVFGVLAPGVWIDRTDEPNPGAHVDANGFEKIGIDNVLLPSGGRIAFARRTDLAASENLLDENAQSARAKLGWHIPDSAIEHVNSHIAAIAQAQAQAQLQGKAQAQNLGQSQTQDQAQAQRHAQTQAAQRAITSQKGLLVLDELGRLELERGGGLVEAVKILDAGPGVCYQHALVVVRSALFERVQNRFESWGELVALSPDETSRMKVVQCYR